MDDDREQNLRLHELHKNYEAEGFFQTNKATIEYSVRTISSLFLLNGAAATALFASKIPDFYPSAIILGLGAFCAVTAFGASYLYNMLLSDTWRPDNEDFTEDEKVFKLDFIGSNKKVSYRDIQKYRLIPIAIVLCSMILFLVGMIVCAISLAYLQ